MLQGRIESKQHRISRACVRDPRGGSGIACAAETQRPTAIGSIREVHAQGEQAVVGQVIVPVLVMALPRIHPIDAALKTANLAAVRDAPNDAEEGRVVEEEHQDIDEGAVLTEPILTNSLVGLWGELACFKEGLGAREEGTGEETGESNMAVRGPVGSKGQELGVGHVEGRTVEIQADHR